MMIMKWHLLFSSKVERHLKSLSKFLHKSFGIPYPLKNLQVFEKKNLKTSPGLSKKHIKNHPQKETCWGRFLVHAFHGPLPSGEKDGDPPPQINLALQWHLAIEPRANEKEFDQTLGIVFHQVKVIDGCEVSTHVFWLALTVVGNEGPSTFTLVYWGCIPSFPTKGQLVLFAFVYLSFERKLNEKK